MNFVMLWVIGGAVGGLVTSQAYLRWMRAGSRRRRRSVERFAVVCALVAGVGYGLAAADCIVSQQCFAPVRMGGLQH